MEEIKTVSIDYEKEYHNELMKRLEAQDEIERLKKALINVCLKLK